MTLEKTQLELNSVTFAVDQEQRTIRGLVVPWDAVSTPKSGKRFRFARDSIKAVAAKFIRFFEDHSPARQFGRAVDMQETEHGLEMTFRVNPGEHGDRMLALAMSGAKTGLSVGVEFDEIDMEPDPDNDGAFLVKLANLYEVSLVQNPSFDNSRVITVMASAEMDQIIMENETITTPEEVVEKNENTEVKAATFSIPEGYQLVPLVPNDAPEVIKPRASTVVTEPANYVFDNSGNLQVGKYDFGLDLVQGFNPDFNDTAARERAQEFILAQFDVVSSNVPGLNPTVNVPKYVDKRDYRSPVFQALNKGKVPNGIQPFAWPLYSSSSGLVAQGTEGTEPSSGTYVTTTQTVTPTTLRGKAKISRETWDMGGLPNIGDQLFKQMVRDYNEALEAKVVAVLTASSPASLGTFTALGGTNGQTLVKELRSNLASLQFARGGFSMGVLFAQADLYLQLIGATDTTGRPILPAVNPMNADGSPTNLWGSININGVTVIPTWGLAAAGQTTAQNSYVVDTTAVDAWADAPRKLVFDNTEVSNVYVGIWGYAAAAINDIAGVRVLSYDPA
jgi:HK97 family phage prohead protease